MSVCKTMRCRASLRDALSRLKAYRCLPACGIWQLRDGALTMQILVLELPKHLESSSSVAPHFAVSVSDEASADAAGLHSNASHHLYLKILSAPQQGFADLLAIRSRGVDTV